MVQGTGKESRCGEWHLAVAVDLDNAAAVQAAAQTSTSMNTRTSLPFVKTFVRPWRQAAARRK
jgi:hypothetical protein